MGHDAVERVGDPAAGPFVFTCEHATRLLPEWEATPADLIHVEDHWGWDIGAADVTRALAARTRSAAVLSRFSRLVCDPNRRTDEPSFVVTEVAGHALSFNRAIDAAERERRVRTYFDPFHDGVDTALATACARGVAHLCSIHSFTPEWEGSPRPIEVGVLYDAHEHHAEVLAHALAAEGFAVAHNEPYSGYEGMIYSANRHGTTHEIPYLELEVRSDLIDTPARADAVAERIARALAVYAPASG